ncbi:MAG: alpha/beta fold hydrolase [Planctomycetales bacterium]|nr:alpha/beta fold hydrolase [Planctomycetales bacterium]
MTPPRIVIVAGWGQTRSTLDLLGRHLKSSDAASSLQIETTSVYELAATCDAATSQREEASDAAPSLYARTLYDEFLRHGPAIVCGWSMGGMVALEAAHAFPEAVSKLVLIASCASFCRRDDAVGVYPWGTPPQSLDEMSQGVAASPERTMALFLRNVYRKSLAAADLDRKVAETVRLRRPLLQHGLQYLLHRDLRGIVPLIRQPTLLLHGKLDRVIPPAAAAYLQERMPQATLQWFEQGTHGLCEQLPLETAQQIEGFLADDERSLH